MSSPRQISLCRTSYSTIWRRNDSAETTNTTAKGAPACGTPTASSASSPRRLSWSSRRYGSYSTVRPARGGRYWHRWGLTERLTAPLAGRQPAQYRILRICSHCVWYTTDTRWTRDIISRFFSRVRRQQWLLGRRGRRLMAPGRHLGHAGDGGCRARSATPLQGGRMHAAVPAGGE